VRDMVQPPSGSVRQGTDPHQLRCDGFDRCRGHCHRNPSESIKAFGCGCLRVIGATLIPNVLRWHWWRFNGGLCSRNFGVSARDPIWHRPDVHWFRARVLPNTCTRHHLAGEPGGVFVGVAAEPATPIAVLRVLYAGPAFRLLAARWPTALPLRRSLRCHGASMSLRGLCADRLFPLVFFLIGHYSPSSAVRSASFCCVASSSIIVGTSHCPHVSEQ